MITHMTLMHARVLMTLTAHKWHHSFGVKGTV